MNKNVLEMVNFCSWEEKPPLAEVQKLIKALEVGKVIYLPKLPFQLREFENRFLSPHILEGNSKNISYDIRHDRLGGACCQNEESMQLKEMLKRYAIQSRQLLENLFPSYAPYLIQARTSFRPVEVAKRVSSYRKDDSLLHIDSFPANPVKGKRILRVFTNINLDNQPRIWRLGEPFPEVVEKIAPRLHRPLPYLSLLLKWLKITKDYRTIYDHYMLQIHNAMKADSNYQKVAKQEEIHFLAASSWIVFTDQASHAAMSGKGALEQTFYLPIEGMQNENHSPLRTLERFFKRRLV